MHEIKHIFKDYIYIVLLIYIIIEGLNRIMCHMINHLVFQNFLSFCIKYRFQLSDNHSTDTFWIRKVIFIFH